MAWYDRDGMIAVTACGPNVVAFVTTGNGCGGGYTVFDMNYDYQIGLPDGATADG
jgi:hypothetical protein